MATLVTIKTFVYDDLAVELQKATRRDGRVYYEVDFIEGDFEYTEGKFWDADEAEALYEEIVASIKNGWRP